jgi:hypothetical protein
MLRRQGWKCVCREGCGQPLWPGAPVRWDHRPPLELGGTAKPNQGVTPHCHDVLTKGDVSQIAKSKRQGKAHRGEKKAKRPFRQPPAGYKTQWPSRKLESRGFEKRTRT